MMLPSLFISHGSPQLALMNNQTTTFLQNLSKSFEHPKAILVISAHWSTRGLRILTNNKPSLIYDFYNFPQELYNLKYEVKNDIDSVQKVIQVLTQKGIDISKDNKREGYDHGVWSILKHIYPKANIPIIQLSLPLDYSINDLLRLGEALQSLRKEILIISSGAMSHNLSKIDWSNIDAKAFNFSENFRNWIIDNLQEGELDVLKEFITKAPYAQMNHPTTEHILPLFVALGASINKKGTSIHNHYMYGQSMESVLFKE